jgi:hypothetical protein
MLGAVLTLGFSSVALRYVTPSLFKVSSHLEPSRQMLEAENAVVSAQQESLRQQEERPVYPYSLVPGGARDVHELKWAAEHDPVVAVHYAGFDYAHARVVPVLLSRSVYLSYRIGNRVYWTRHKVALKKGESLLTDGKLTARTRCANRVEEAPQQESSNLEPPAVKFDEPVRPALGTALETPPVPLETALLGQGLGPAPPLGLYDPIGGGGWTPLSPPPLPSVCGIGTTKKPAKGTEIVSTANGKKNVDPCSSGGIGGEVPEPGTWLLVGSGLAFLFWKSRQKFAINLQRH